MTSAEKLIEKYRNRGYSLNAIRLLAESREQPLGGEMLRLIDSLEEGGAGDVLTGGRSGNEALAEGEASEVACETAEFRAVASDSGAVFFIAEEEGEVGADAGIDFDVMAGTSEGSEPMAGSMDSDSVADIVIGETSGSELVARGGVVLNAGFGKSISLAASNAWHSMNSLASSTQAHELGIWSRFWSKVSGVGEETPAAAESFAEAAFADERDGKPVAAEKETEATPDDAEKGTGVNADRKLEPAAACPGPTASPELTASPEPTASPVTAAPEPVATGSEQAASEAFCEAVSDGFTVGAELHFEEDAADNINSVATEPESENEIAAEAAVAYQADSGQEIMPAAAVGPSRTLDAWDASDDYIPGGENAVAVAAAAGAPLSEVISGGKNLLVEAQSLLSRPPVTTSEAATPIACGSADGEEKLSRAERRRRERGEKKKRKKADKNRLAGDLPEIILTRSEGTETLTVEAKREVESTNADEFANGDDAKLAADSPAQPWRRESKRESLNLLTPVDLVEDSDAVLPEENVAAGPSVASTALRLLDRAVQETDTPFTRLLESFGRMEKADRDIEDRVADMAEEPQEPVRAMPEPNLGGQPNDGGFMFVVAAGGYAEPEEGVIRLTDVSGFTGALQIARDDEEFSEDDAAAAEAAPAGLDAEDDRVIHFRDRFLVIADAVTDEPPEDGDAAAAGGPGLRLLPPPAEAADADEDAILAVKPLQLLPPPVPLTLMQPAEEGVKKKGTRATRKNLRLSKNAATEPVQEITREALPEEAAGNVRESLQSLLQATLQGAVREALQVAEPAVTLAAPPLAEPTPAAVSEDLAAGPVAEALGADAAATVAEPPPEAEFQFILEALSDWDNMLPALSSPVPVVALVPPPSAGEAEAAALLMADPGCIQPPEALAETFTEDIPATPPENDFLLPETRLGLVRWLVGGPALDNDPVINDDLLAERNPADADHAAADTSSAVILDLSDDTVTDAFLPEADASSSEMAAGTTAGRGSVKAVFPGRTPANLVEDPVEHVISCLPPDPEPVDFMLREAEVRAEMEQEYQARLDGLAQRLLEIQTAGANSEARAREARKEAEERANLLLEMGKRIEKGEEKRSELEKVLDGVREESHERQRQIDTLNGICEEHQRLYDEFEDLRKAYNEVVTDVLPTLQNERDDLAMTVERQCELEKKLRGGLGHARRRLSVGYGLGAAASLMLLALPVANWLKSPDVSKELAVEHQAVTELKENLKREVEQNIASQSKMVELENKMSTARAQIADLQSKNKQLAQAQAKAVQQAKQAAASQQASQNTAQHSPGIAVFKPADSGSSGVPTRTSVMALQGTPQAGAKLHVNEIRDPAGSIEQVVAVNRQRSDNPDNRQMASALRPGAAASSLPIPGQPARGREERIALSGVAVANAGNSGKAANAGPGLRPAAEVKVAVQSPPGANVSVSSTSGGSKKSQARAGEVTAKVKKGEGVAQVVYRVLGTWDPEVVSWVVRENELRLDKRGNPVIQPDQQLRLPKEGRVDQAASAAPRR